MTSSGRLTLIAAALAGALVCITGCGERPEIPPYESLLPVETPPVTPKQFHSVGALDPAVGPLRSIALDAGRRLFAVGAKGVAVLDTAGKSLASWPLPSDGWAIAVSDNGTVYVGLDAKVLIFDATGKALGSFGVEGAERGQLRRITSIATHGEEIFVADARNLCINRYAFNGDFINDIGKENRAKDQVGFIAPSPYMDVVPDPSDPARIIASNPGRLRVETWNVDGTFVTSWGKPGLAPERFEGCCNPTNLAVMRDGAIVTSEKGIPRLKVTASDGSLVAYLPPGVFGPKAAGIDLAVDSEDRVYAADPVTGKVTVYELVASTEPDR